MNVNINIKTATARLKSFIKDHGGKTQHSEVLELLAHMCGFDCYRAMKTATSQSTSPDEIIPIQGQIRPTFARVDNKLLEDPAHVVFRASAVDWKLQDDPDIGLDELPQEHRRPYDFVVEQYGSQFRVMFKPEGVGANNFGGEPLLDMLLEINEGVPCAHLTNEPEDAMLLSVFGTGEGLLARPDDGSWGRATRSLPPAMQDLVSRACDEYSLDDALVCLMDTKSRRVAPAPNPREKEALVRVAIEEPKDACLDGLMVASRLKKLTPSDPHLTLFIGLEETTGEPSIVGQEGLEFAGQSSFMSTLSSQSSAEVIQAYLEATSRLAATLLAGDIPLADVLTLVRKLVTCDADNPTTPLSRSTYLLDTEPDIDTIYLRLVTYVCTVY